MKRKNSMFKYKNVVLNGLSNPSEFVSWNL